MPSRNLTIIFVASIFSTLCFKEAQRSRYAHALSNVIDTISLHYVKDVDKRQLFENGITGMVQNLDPFSGYFSPDDLKQFNSEMRQEFGGVGIEVGLRDNRLTVISPLPGTPAYKAGLMQGDIILAVDGKSAENTQLSDLVKLIQGKPGTTVTLEILHAGQTKPETIPIERAIIEVETIRGDRRTANGDWIYTLKNHDRIGYIQLTKFAQKTTEELKKTLDGVQGDIDGLILDLRGNPGGLLDAAVDICDLFTEKDQEIVSIKRRRGVLEQRFESKKPPFVSPNLPIVVLVNQFSASASEILAACLQDHGRAVVVGQRTYGKGTVQNIIKIEAGKSALRLTTATYWRPSEKNIHRHVGDDESAEWGVQPAPENRIELTDAEYQALQKKRYEFESNSNNDANNDANNNDGNDSETSFESFDLQLQRAIDVLDGTQTDHEHPAQAA